MALNYPSTLCTDHDIGGESDSDCLESELEEIKPGPCKKSKNKGIRLKTDFYGTVVEWE